MPNDKKVSVSKEKKVAKTDDKKKSLWLGGDALMAQPKNDKEAAEQKLIFAVAKVLDVSPFGVNILGSVPYINKLGLVQKAQEYSKGKVFFQYRWVQIAKNDDEKAICECRLVVPVEVSDKGDSFVPLTDWVLGECSTETMGMKTLKGYQNHMAQTRARNRAILEAYGNRIHEDMLERLGKLKATDEEKMLALGATSTSAEEMEPRKAPASSATEALPEITQSDFEDIAEDINKLNLVKSKKEFETIRKELDIKRKAGEYNEVQTTYFRVLIARIDKKFASF